MSPVCCAFAYATELSLSTLSAAARLIGAATFALISDIAARSGSSSPAIAFNSSRVSCLYSWSLPTAMPPSGVTWIGRWGSAGSRPRMPSRCPTARWRRARHSRESRGSRSRATSPRAQAALRRRVRSALPASTCDIRRAFVLLPQAVSGGTGWFFLALRSSLLSSRGRHRSAAAAHSRRLRPLADVGGDDRVDICFKVQGWPLLADPALDELPQLHRAPVSKFHG